MDISEILLGPLMVWNEGDELPSELICNFHLSNRTVFRESNCYRMIVIVEDN
jgi:hypothetical protein